MLDTHTLILSGRVCDYVPKVCHISIIITELKAGFDLSGMHRSYKTLYDLMMHGY